MFVKSFLVNSIFEDSKQINVGDLFLAEQDYQKKGNKFAEYCLYFRMCFLNKIKIIRQLANGKKIQSGFSQ